MLWLYDPEQIDIQAHIKSSTKLLNTRVKDYQIKGIPMKFPAPPRGIKAIPWRMPIWIYRLGFGFIMGRRSPASNSYRKEIRTGTRNSVGDR